MPSLSYNLSRYLDYSHQPSSSTLVLYIIHSAHALSSLHFVVRASLLRFVPAGWCRHSVPSPFLRITTFLTSRPLPSRRTFRHSVLLVLPPSSAFLAYELHSYILFAPMCTHLPAHIPSLRSFSLPPLSLR